MAKTRRPKPPKKAADNQYRFSASAPHQYEEYVERLIESNELNGSSALFRHMVDAFIAPVQATEAPPEDQAGSGLIGIAGKWQGLNLFAEIFSSKLLYVITPSPLDWISGHRLYQTLQQRAFASHNQRTVILTSGRKWISDNDIEFAVRMVIKGAEAYFASDEGARKFELYTTDFHSTFLLITDEKCYWSPSGLLPPHLLPFTFVFKNLGYPDLDNDDSGDRDKGGYAKFFRTFHTMLPALQLAKLENVAAQIAAGTWKPKPPKTPETPPYVLSQLWEQLMSSLEKKQ